MHAQNVRKFLKDHYEKYLNGFKLCLMRHPEYDLSILDTAVDKGYASVDEPSPEIVKRAAQNYDLGATSEYDYAVVAQQVAQSIREAVKQISDFSRQLRRFEVDEDEETKRILASGKYSEFPEALLEEYAGAIAAYRAIDTQEQMKKVNDRLVQFMEASGFKSSGTYPTPPEPKLAEVEDFVAPTQGQDTENQGGVEQTSPRQLIEDFFDANESRLSDGSIKNYRAIFDRLVAFLGEDFIMETFTHRHAREFEKFLRKMPKNLNKDPNFRNLSQRELFDRLQVSKGVDLLSERTIRNYITKISTLFSFASTRGYTSENFFKGWLPSTKKDASQTARQSRFTDNEVLALLPSNEDLKELKKDYQKWIVQIGAYSGMRLDEICSLHIGNIREINGIPCFDLTQTYPRQSYKTPSALRIIPIHDELIQAGFLEFWRARKRTHSEDQQLFVHCTYTGGKFSKNASRWFNESHRGHRGWKGLKGIKNDEKRKLTFHSLRHTFVSKALEQQGAAPIHLIQFLVGHAPENITVGVYGRGATRDISDLARIVNAIEYQSD
ncbi:site-specific integrase [Salinisphaera sp. USBA-960]|nr:site-specific integrase [Salifodinibacter halophilus]NNC25908.1 site-specific integrase [Salifodinibacter halophilus]